MNESAIDNLAESVWRRVVACVGTDECCHEKHEKNEEFITDPDDCGLYREIRDAIVLWANARNP